MRSFLMIWFLAIGVSSLSAKTMPVNLYVDNVHRKWEGKCPFKVPYEEPTEAEKEKYLYENYGSNQGRLPLAYLEWVCEILLTENRVKDTCVVTNFIDKTNAKYIANEHTNPDSTYVKDLKQRCIVAVRSLATIKGSAFPIYLKYLQTDSAAIHEGVKEAFSISLKRNDPGVKEFLLKNIHSRSIYKREDLVFDLFARDFGSKPLWSEHELSILEKDETDPQMKRCISNIIEGYKTASEIIEWNQDKSCQSLNLVQKPVKTNDATALGMFPIGIPDDSAIVLKDGDSIGIAILREQTTQPETLSFDWFLRTDGKVNFSPNAKAVKGDRRKMFPR